MTGPFAAIYDALRQTPDGRAILIRAAFPAASAGRAKPLDRERATTIAAMLNGDVGAFDAPSPIAIPEYRAGVGWTVVLAVPGTPIKRRKRRRK